MNRSWVRATTIQRRRARATARGPAGHCSAGRSTSGRRWRRAARRTREAAPRRQSCAATADRRGRVPAAAHGDRGERCLHDRGCKGARSHDGNHHERNNEPPPHRQPATEPVGCGVDGDIGQQCRDRHVVCVGLPRRVGAVLNKRTGADRDDEQAVDHARAVVPTTRDNREAGNHEGQAGDSRRRLPDNASVVIELAGIRQRHGSRLAELS